MPAAGCQDQGTRWGPYLSKTTLGKNIVRRNNITQNNVRQNNIRKNNVRQNDVRQTDIVPKQYVEAACSVLWRLKSQSKQGCQMVYFQTKNHNLGKFWRVLQWKMLVYFVPFVFVAIWHILWPFGIYYGHLAYLLAIWHMYLMAIWHILWPFGISYGHLDHFTRFGMFDQEKSGNPDSKFFADAEKSGKIFLHVLTVD
jgi:hypothetical protein